MKKDKNQWEKHLRGEYTAPLAVKQKPKKARNPKVSSKQRRAIRSD